MFLLIIMDPRCFLQVLFCTISNGYFLKFKEIKNSFQYIRINQVLRKKFDELNEFHIEGAR